MIICTFIQNTLIENNQRCKIGNWKKNVCKMRTITQQKISIHYIILIILFIHVSETYDNNTHCLFKIVAPYFSIKENWLEPYQFYES